MTTPDIAGLCEELRESANAICDDPPFHDREGDPVPPVVDPDKLFDAADTLERQAAEIERLRGALEPIAARPVPDGCTDNALIGWISAGAIRKARAALTGEDTAGSPTSQNTEPGLAFSDAGER
jgi:hypothetical protein